MKFDADDSMLLSSEEEDTNDSQFPSVDDQLKKYLGLPRRKVKNILAWWEVCTISHYLSSNAENPLL